MTAHFPIIALPNVVDARGNLTILDRALPFDVVRAFWIMSADGQTRGGHRHRQTRQALIAMAGWVDIFMDDSTHQEVIRLGEPNQCLLVEPKDWHTMTFGPSSILLVLASRHYDRDDYIDARY